MKTVEAEKRWVSGGVNQMNSVLGNRIFIVALPPPAIM